MSRITISCLLALLPLPQLFAQQQQRVNIEQASVFLHGAEVSSTAKVSLPKGETEILFTNVAGNILQQSLTVGADNGVVVQSATPQNDYLTGEAITPRAQAIKDSIETLNENILLLNDKKTVIEEQIAVLRENRKVTGGDKGLPVAELQKMLDLVNTRLNALLAEKHEADKKTTKINERIVLLNRQLEEEKKKNYQPGGQVLVKFYSEKATTANISMSYVVNDAGWTPSYDLRVEKINTPVKLFYKANIYQNTGVKWDNIKIVLSTGNPSEGAEAPTLAPWYLSFYAPQVNSSAYFNSVQLNRAGYSNKDVDAKYETRALKVAPSTVNDYTQVDNSGINTSFDIDLPYTIPSDGKPHLVAIKEYELPASYRYFAVPKLDRDAFLQARITNWESLNLLPAQTNVFYEGTYVGQGYIDMRNVKDTMNISLGRDKKIIIRREKDKDYHAKNLAGTTRQTYAYTISVRNTRPDAIDLMVLDQFPVSNDKDITIEEQTAENANIEDNGSVKWLINVPANQLQKLKLSYTVKYPKGKSIGNLY